MIAALPMYDRPELADAHNALWARIRGALLDEGIEAPRELTHDPDLWAIWSSPELLLAQTCGLPFRARLHPNVTIVGTFDYGLPDIPPGYYRSAIVARSERSGAFSEFDGASLAINEALSQSGWAAPSAEADLAGITLSPGPETGSHRASAIAVANGAADLAALDAVTWMHLEAFEPDLAQALRVVHWSRPTPGLPLITAAGRDPAPLREAVTRGISATPPETLKALRIRDAVLIPTEAYIAEAIPASPWTTQR